MMFGFKIRRVACSVLAATALSAVSSFAVTSQFRGVNWADKRDNFVSDVQNGMYILKIQRDGFSYGTTIFRKKR